MSLELVIFSVLLGVPSIMLALVLWAALRSGTELDPKDIPEFWGSQDIDHRMKD